MLSIRIYRTPATPITPHPPDITHAVVSFAIACFRSNFTYIIVSGQSNLMPGIFRASQGAGSMGTTVDYVEQSLKYFK